jgi:hypothetical protein
LKAAATAKFPSKGKNILAGKINLPGVWRGDLLLLELAAIMRGEGIGKALEDAGHIRCRRYHLYLTCHGAEKVRCVKRDAEKIAT